MSAVRTLLPFDTDDLSVLALADGAVAVVHGRATMNLSAAEAYSVGDCLVRAAAENGYGPKPTTVTVPVLNAPPALPPVPAPAGDVPLQARVDAGMNAWGEYWIGYNAAGPTFSRVAFEEAMRFAIKRALEVQP